MDLILWRHAEAEDIASTDLARALTTRGRKQAQTVAKWLRTRLPDDAVILASPAVRTIQTAETLSDQYRVARELAARAGAKRESAGLRSARRLAGRHRADGCDRRPPADLGTCRGTPARRHRRK